jgi:predicted dehydrogenase
VSDLARLRVALFGVGLVGQASHAPVLAGEPDRFDLVAIADPSETARTAVAARYRVPQTVATLEEALALGVDAIVIAVPDPAHRAAVLTALEAGVHVFCEKPLAVSVGEVDEILAARGDRVVQVGYMKLYDPAVERLVEELRDGPVEIVHLTVEVNDPDQAPFVDHLDLVAGRDVPRELIDATRAGEAAAIRDALGTEPDAAETRAFVDAILADRPVEVTGADSQAALAIALAADRSMREGRSVPL